MTDVSYPLVTADFRGTGGRIKDRPEHFVVEEIPLFEISGDGDHVYVRARREGWTSRALAGEFRRLFDLRETDVGTAGLKDRHARVTQTFSLYLPDRAIDLAEVRRRLETDSPCEVLDVARHGTKLRTGKLAGNRFEIVVVDVADEGVGENAGGVDDAALATWADALRDRGLPNYYGEQRFGVRGDNAEVGRNLILGRARFRPSRWKRRLLLSAWQSGLFNRWLAQRIETGDFARLIEGDLAKRLDSGGLFAVDDSDAETHRLDDFEISPTGPMFGTKMPAPAGEAAVRERRLLEDDGVTADDLRRARLTGTRRAARLPIPDLDVARVSEGIRLRFSLPAGAYATSVVRELTHAD